MLKWFPRNVSSYGAAIDDVFYLIFYIVGIWFLLTEGLILYFAFRYRRREGTKASFVTGERWRQVAWILIPGAIVLLLDLAIDFQGARAYARVKGKAPPASLSIRIHGKQFNWLITYPGPDGVFGTPDDLTEENEINVPVGKVVGIVFTSEDVIHSFFVPALRLKQDLVPGREIPGWFEVTEPGTYEIACAELCGFGHYTMRGLLIARSEEDHEAWVQQQWPPF